MSQARRLLVVDDDDAVRGLLTATLRHAGYEVEDANNGRAALDKLATGRFELIVLDVMMPDMSGLEVLEAVRQRFDRESLPVLLLTAGGEKDLVVEALRRGATDYAQKPIRRADLLERVAANLPRTAPKVGDTFAGYVLELAVGEGAAGVVYRAKEPLSGRIVALKLLDRSRAALSNSAERFRKEAEITAKLLHPNLVRVLSAGEARGQLYIAMEWLPRGDLAGAVGAAQPTVVEALRIGAGIAQGLAALASIGILHRDIKPENVLLDDQGVPKISDFGLARGGPDDRALTAEGFAVGTLPYIAPEQLLGRPELRSDIYSLGCTLYYALTGEPPFPIDAGPRETIRAKLAPPPRVKDRDPRISDAVDAYVATLMAPEAADRPSTPEEIRSRLLALAHDEDRARAKS